MRLLTYEVGGIFLNSYEKESVFKNFLVFFWLLELLLVLLFIELYSTQKREYLQKIFNNMQLCSYTYQCPKYTFEFIPKSRVRLNTLHQDKNLYAYFPIPRSDKFNLKITYTKKMYMNDLRQIQKLLFIKFILATLLLMGVALYFTLYSLKPIRKALLLNDEFIKDVLHDFNTPISSIVLNLNMFKREYGSNLFVSRITRSVDTILMLQNNLKIFLQHAPAPTEKVQIDRVALQRMELMQTLYPRITFVFYRENELTKWTNPEFFIRILDNLLNNAAKYNKPGGEVKLSIIKERIIIEDTGKGIEDVKRVFTRYYKEQERGIGLGLHIVKKLLQELHIDISIDSIPKKGTTVTLYLDRLKDGEVQ